MDEQSPSKPGLSSAGGALSVKREFDISEASVGSVSEDAKQGTSEMDSGQFASPGGSGEAYMDEPSEGSLSGRMDEAKISSMQHIVDTAVSTDSRQRINQLLAQVETLTHTEKLLLYLRLPTGLPLPDPLKQPLNPLGSRSEIQQTVNWIQTHLEVDAEVSLPKQDVYDEYIAFAMSSGMKPLSTADFGKVMKQVYPAVRPRRLGTRGNSRYCYAGLRKKVKLEVPRLPELTDKPKIACVPEIDTSSHRHSAIVREWAGKMLGIKFENMEDLAKHLLSQNITEKIETQQMSPSVLPYQDVEQSLGEQVEQRARGVIKQLKRKIQASPGRPKKNKEESITSPLAAPIPPLSPAPPPPSSFPSPYHIPLQSSYLLYQPPSRAHADYLDPYKYDPYLPPRYAHTNLPMNLSTDVARPPTYYREQSSLSVPTTSLDLSSPGRHEAPSTPPQPPPPPPPPKLPLPGKKMILEAYQNQTQAASPRPQQQFVREETTIVDYLPKKMRAAEISGGKVRAHQQQADMMRAQASTSRLHELTQPKAEDKDKHEDPSTFFEDPKNVTCRSRNDAAALVPRGTRQGGATGKPTRGRPRKTSTTKAKYVRRKHKNISDQIEKKPIQEMCCGLDGINYKTGLICEENHCEILNRERVISICSMDKHALDDYLNEGSSQEHEAELMQYFHDTRAKSDQAGGTKKEDFLEQTNNDIDKVESEKIEQIRELLVKNLKNSSRSTSPQKPNDMVTYDAQTNDGNNKFKSIAGPNMGDPPAQNNVPSLLVSRRISFENTFAPSIDPMMEKLKSGMMSDPQSPVTRTQHYDFVPISPTDPTPRTNSLNSLAPWKDLQRVRLNGSFSLNGSPCPFSTEASPFVSPRNTPVPRSKAAQKPMPNKNSRTKTGPNGSINLLSKTNYSLPYEQTFSPNSPGCSSRYPPMSAPASPNIHTARYQAKFPTYPMMESNMHDMQQPGSSHMHHHFQQEPIVEDGASQKGQVDVLSCEVSQLFQNNTPRRDSDSFRSQSAPLNKNFFTEDPSVYESYQLPLTYNIETPSNSVPPTPVPKEFCDFGPFSETCDTIPLNSESLNRIYNVLDSSQDMMNVESLNEGPLQNLLVKEIEFCNRVDSDTTRTNSIDYELNDVLDKGKFYSRSVPSTPLSYKKSNPLTLNHNICKNLTPELNTYNNIISKSVPCTPLFMDERTMFSYNKDFLINGNSLSMDTLNSFEGTGEMKQAYMNGEIVKHDGNAALMESLQASPLEEILQGTLHTDLHSFTTQNIPNDSDLLADLDKISNQPYGVM